MDDLKRELDNLDRSPTVQAVLIVAVIWARYMVGRFLTKRRAHRHAKVTPHKPKPKLPEDP